jgi:hypothetical protein
MLHYRENQGLTIYILKEETVCWSETSFANFMKLIFNNSLGRNEYEVNFYKKTHKIFSFVISQGESPEVPPITTYY